MGFLAYNNTQMTISGCRVIFSALPLVKSVGHSGNRPINFTCCMRIVTLLHSTHFQALLSCTTIPHSTRLLVCFEPHVHAKDSHVISHHSKDMNSTKMVLPILKYPAISTSQDMGQDIYVNHKCL